VAHATYYADAVVGLVDSTQCTHMDGAARATCFMLRELPAECGRRWQAWLAGASDEGRGQTAAAEAVGLSLAQQEAQEKLLSSEIDDTAPVAPGEPRALSIVKRTQSFLRTLRWTVAQDIHESALKEFPPDLQALLNHKKVFA